MIKLFCIALLMITLSTEAQIISKKTLEKITEYDGKPRAWIHDIQFINKSSYFVKGNFKGELRMGDTTLVSGDEYKNFVTLFKKDVQVNSFVLPDIEFTRIYAVKNGDFIMTGNIGFPQCYIRCYDSEFNLKWDHRFSLTNTISDLSIFYFQDIKVDDNGNVYALLQFADGDFERDGNVFPEKGDVLLKINPAGKILFVKHIAKTFRFSKLALIRDKIFAMYNQSIAAFDVNDGDSVQVGALENLSITSDVKSKGYYKLFSNNSKPEKFSVVKYNKQGNELLRNEVFECNGIKRTGELIDLDKRRLLFINKNHVGALPASGMSDYALNFFVIYKKNLRVVESWTIDCDNIDEDLVLRKRGNNVYIAFTYFKGGQFGDIVLHNDKEFPFNESFALLKYRIR